jgi:choice-of-anchor A domain-containing protein
VTLRRRRVRRTSPDAGFSFVEVLVSVVILGLAGVAVLGAAAAAARGSSVQRSHSNAQSVIAAAADEIMGMTPVVCSSARLTYQAAARDRVAALQLGAGWTGDRIEVGPVREWDPASNQFQPYADPIDPESSPLSACDTDTPELLTPHLVPLTVTSPNGNAIKHVDVVTSAIPDRVPIGNPLVFGESPFAVLTFGDLRMEGQLHVYGGAAVGGNLSFDGNQASLGHTSEPGVYTDRGDGAPSSLIVEGRVNYYPESSGVLNVKSGWLHIGDMRNGEYATESSGLVLRGIPASAPRITFDPTITQAPGTIERAGIYDFVAAQRVFAAESLALSQLPAQCADAKSARLLDHGNPATSESKTAKWELWPDRVNVLSSELQYLPNFPVGKSNDAGPNTPLIVNVIDGGSVTFSRGFLTDGMATATIWNFPNATELHITGHVDGSVLAPSAHVTIDSDVNGGIIAGSLSGGYAVKWAQYVPDIRDVLCDRGI